MPSHETTDLPAKRTWSLPIWAVFSALAAILLVGVFVVGPPDHDEEQYTRWEDRRECPHSPRFTEVGLPQDSARSVMLEIDKQFVGATGGTHDVPEYNDCQRFLAPGSRLQPVYDSLFSIFAVKLDSLEIRLRNLSLPPRVGLAAAIVWAEGDYPPLNIQAGFNCLVMALVPPGTGSQWIASMVPAHNEADCSDTFEMEEILPVRRTYPMPQRKDHYPPIVRWGFDEATWEQFIAITCGEATCYIGQRATLDLHGVSRPKAPTLAAAPVVYPGVAPAFVQRVHDVVVWHDMQFLASLPAPPTAGAPSDPLVPTSVRGTVIPHPELGTYQKADFDDQWVDVAVVDFSDLHADYLDRMGYQGPTSPDRRNLVQACRSPTGGACPRVPEDVLEKCRAYPESPTDPSLWYTRHISADSLEIRYKCVQRFAAKPGIEVPGAARWRWAEELDEVLWFRCDQGCCDEQG